MENDIVSKKLNWMIALFAVNLLITLAGIGVVVLGLLPKVERTVENIDRVVETTERVEARFQEFADEVQPVVTAGAGKAIETIKKVDAEQLSETVTDKTDSLIEAAAEKAKRFLEKDKE